MVPDHLDLTAPFRLLLCSVKSDETEMSECPHCDLYGARYYQEYEALRADADHGEAPPYAWGEPVWEELFAGIADQLVAHLRPRTSLDAGCAIGFLVKALYDRGVEAEGVDISEWAIAHVPVEIAGRCWVQSLTKDLPGRYDLITCIEVLEHLSPAHAAAAVANLCRHTETVLFSSTPEHFDEVTHVNVRPAEYWAALFARHGFYRDVDFDAAFVSPHAVLFRAVPGPTAAAGYERWARHLRSELEGVRAHRQSLHQQVQALIGERDQAKAELRALHATKTLRLTAGVRAAWAAARHPRAKRAQPPSPAPENAPPAPSLPTYLEWVDAFDTPAPAVPGPAAADSVGSRPALRFSILMPVCDPAEDHLERAIESVLAQTYEHWELCIADDGSTAMHVRPMLERYQHLDSRIQVAWLPENRGIVDASNRALELAGGEFVALMDHDDEIAPHALACVARELADHPDAHIVYSDEDKIGEDGRRCQPYFKPDWSPLLFTGQNYLSHLGVYRRDLVVAVGGFRPGFEGSQDYDLAMRISERSDPQQIRHIPLVLYHWRMHPGSTSLRPEAKPYARGAALRTVADHLVRVAAHAEVVPAANGAGTRVRTHLRERLPTVRVLVTDGAPPARRRTLSSLRGMTDYRECEVVESAAGWLFRAAVAGDETLDGAAPAEAAGSRGDDRASEPQVLCAVAAGVEVIESGWLRELVGQLQDPQVGLVGGRIELSDGALTRGPLAFGPTGAGLAPLDGLGRLMPGYFGHAWLAHAVGALPAGCIAIRREVLEQVGGGDPKLDLLWRAVDLSLRVRRGGYVVVWTPYARLSFGVEADELDLTQVPRRPDGGVQLPAQLVAEFAGLLEADPAYSGNLSLDPKSAFAPAWPPRRAPQWAPTGPFSGP